jgi:hypothetical protein
MALTLCLKSCGVGLPEAFGRSQGEQCFEMRPCTKKGQATASGTTCGAGLTWRKGDGMSSLRPEIGGTPLGKVAD